MSESACMFEALSVQKNAIWKWKQTLEECNKGWLRGPMSFEEVPKEPQYPNASGWDRSTKSGSFMTSLSRPLTRLLQFMSRRHCTLLTLLLLPLYSGFKAAARPEGVFPFCWRLLTCPAPIGKLHRACTAGNFFSYFHQSLQSWSSKLVLLPGLSTSVWRC